MKKHPYHTPKAALFALSPEDLLTASGEGGDNSGGGSGGLDDPFWQGGDIVFPDIPLG